MLIQKEIVIISHEDHTQKFMLSRNADFLEWQFYVKWPTKGSSRWLLRKSVSVAITDITSFIAFLRLHVGQWPNPEAADVYTLEGNSRVITCRARTSISEPYFVFRSISSTPNESDCRVDLCGSDIQALLNYFEFTLIAGSVRATSLPVFGLS